MAMNEPAVRVRNLGVDLGTGPILADVTLELAAAQFMALLGANGSGKSTLVKTLLGLTPISSGRVEVLGVDIGRAKRSALPWQRVGYVPQRLTASGGVPATAIEVVTSGVLSHRKFRSRRASQDALAALDRVGLADRGRESVHLLSGGQQQRVLIARALVRDPDFLILDEPLSGIDRESRRALSDTLSTLQREGTTILAVLHELGELQDLVQRSVVLRHGRVIHDGPALPPRPGHEHPDHDHVHPHESPATNGFAVPLSGGFDR